MIESKDSQTPKPLCVYCAAHNSIVEANVGFNIPAVGGRTQVDLCIRHFDELRQELEMIDRKLRKKSLIVLPGRNN